MDRLRTVRHPGVRHSGGLKIDGVGGRGMVETVTEGGQRFVAAWRK